MQAEEGGGVRGLAWIQLEIDLSFLKCALLLWPW